MAFPKINRVRPQPDCIPVNPTASIVEKLGMQISLINHNILERHRIIQHLERVRDAMWRPPDPNILSFLTYGAYGAQRPTGRKKPIILRTRLPVAA